MDFKIVLTPNAIEDLGRIVRRISNDNTDAAEKMGFQLIDRVAILGRFPFIGAVVSKRKNLRMFPIRKYVAYYRPVPEKNIVEILGYRHGAQEEGDFLASKGVREDEE